MARTSAESSPGFRADVQGLRAVAVGLVILYHFNLFGVTGGFVGVDVFFVISGFVIAGLILREVGGTGRVSLLSFYARRARRILPASSLTLIVTVAASVVLFGRYGAYTIAQDAESAALFVANFHFASVGVNYFQNTAPASPLLHFWSLAVEEQFYFVFPSIVLAVALVSRSARDRIRVRVGWVVTGIVAVSLWWSIYETGADPTSAYYSIATRAWELGVGVLCAVVIHRLGRVPARISWPVTLIGAGLIAFSAFDLTNVTAFTTYPGSIAIVPVVGAALLILGGASAPARSITTVLSTRAFTWVGDLSYSLYLWHFPVIAIATRYYNYSLSLGQRLLLLVVAIVLSIASFYLVEQPIRSSTFLRTKTRWSFVVGATCVSCALLVAAVPVWSVTVRPGTIVTGHPALTALQQEIVTALTLHNIPRATDPALSLELPESDFGLPAMINNCNPSTYQTTVPSCAYGDVASSTTVVLYGNSQAQMWAPALAQLGTLDHFKLVPIAKPACGTFVDHSYIGPNGQVSSICSDFVQWSITRINSLHPTVVIVASTPGTILKPGANPGQLNADGRLPSSSIIDPSTNRTVVDFRRLVHDLAPSGAKIVLFGAIPQTYVHGVLPSPTECLLENTSNIQRCTLREPTLHNSPWLRSFSLAAERAGVTFINVDPMVCADGRCPPVIGDVLVKFDQLHLTGPFVNYSARALGELLGTTLPQGLSTSKQAT
jgi:peptidoglycan/LPS O-acetylase OafA/YrhL